MKVPEPGRLGQDTFEWMRQRLGAVSRAELPAADQFTFLDADLLALAAKCQHSGQLSRSGALIPVSALLARGLLASLPIHPKHYCQVLVSGSVHRWHAGDTFYAARVDVEWPPELPLVADGEYLVKREDLEARLDDDAPGWVLPRLSWFAPPVPGTRAEVAPATREHRGDGPYPWWLDIDAVLEHADKIPVEQISLSTEALCRAALIAGAFGDAGRWRWQSRHEGLDRPWRLSCDLPARGPIRSVTIFVMPQVGTSSTSEPRS